jgi:hypothetical protein
LTLIDGVRNACAALPEVTEKVSHGAPAWFARDRWFVSLLENGHHQNQFPHLWCAAPPGVQEELVAAFPERFFRPPYVGHRGWVALRLVPPVDWEGVTALCADGWRTVAPAPLLRGAGP